MAIAERRKNLLGRIRRTYRGPGLKNRAAEPGSENAGSGNFFTRLERWLAGNSIGLPLQDFILMIIFFISLVLIISVFFKTGLLIFVLLSALLVFLVYVIIDYRGRRLVKKKEEQLEIVLIDLVTVLYVNPNISVALKKAAENADDPIRRELELVIEDTQRGLLLNEALSNMLKRNRSRLIHVVITGLIAANEKGVDLVVFLKNQIDYLREKRSLSNYVRILSSGPRYTSYMIVAIPLIVLLAAAFINQSFTAVLFSTAGRLVLGYSAISYLFGFFLINRIVNLTDNDRDGSTAQ